MYLDKRRDLKIRIEELVIVSWVIDYVERVVKCFCIEKNVLIQDNTQSTMSGEEAKRPPSFMDSIKKEYFENIQAAAKLDDLKNYYQKKNDKM